MYDGATETRIAIRIEGREPMRGVVETGEAATPQCFVGWLGLLKVLQESLASEGGEGA